MKFLTSFLNSFNMNAIQHFNGTLIDMQLKTKNGTIINAASKSIHNTTKENPFTHFRFILTGRERFKPFGWIQESRDNEDQFY